MKGLSDGNHARGACDHRRIADVVDRMKGEPGVVVDEVVEPARPHRKARHDRPGDDACGDKVDDGLGDHVGMDRKIVAVRQMRQHPIRDATETDLKRRAIVDEPSDVPGDLLRHVVR